jgi:uncharacterized repeat protein (TIGR01451 family)
VVDRQSGGVIPPPGTNPKDFKGNWWGTTSPVVTIANSTEPGYAAQIPVAYGGTAVPPGGQPDIAGPASANVIYNPVLCSGTDTNIETTPGRGTIGFQGDPSRDTFYRDADGDGYGNPAISIQACSAPAGYVSDNTDCNDSNASIHPNAPEVCNGIDDDCDGLVDEGFTDTDGDHIADCVDPDDDNDTIPDPSDNCPLTPNTNQADADHDGIGDACEASADLRVTKTAMSKVKTGAKLLYVVTVRNNGPNSAPNVVISDNLPAGTTFVSANPTQGSCNRVGNLVTCNLGNLANGHIAAVLLVVKVTAPAGATLNNMAVGSSSHPDSNLSNNSASASTKVVRPNEDDRDEN